MLAADWISLSNLKKEVKFCSTKATYSTAKQLCQGLGSDLFWMEDYDKEYKDSISMIWLTANQSYTNIWLNAIWVNGTFEWPYGRQINWTIDESDDPSAANKSVLLNLIEDTFTCDLYCAKLYNRTSTEKHQYLCQRPIQTSKKFKRKPKAARKRDFDKLPFVSTTLTALAVVTGTTALVTCIIMGVYRLYLMTLLGGIAALPISAPLLLTLAATGLVVSGLAITAIAFAWWYW